MSIHLALYALAASFGAALECGPKTSRIVVIGALVIWPVVVYSLF